MSQRGSSQQGYGQQTGGSYYQYQQQPQGQGTTQQYQQPPQMQPPTTGGQQQQQQSRSRLRPVTLEEVVQSDVVTVGPDEQISSVVATMADESVGSIVVVDDGEPVGIVTDRAIALALAGTSDLAERSVEDVMHTDLVTATPDTNVFDAISTLGDGGVRRLPIVGDDGRLEGIVSLDDLVVLLGTELNNATEVIRKQSTRY